MGFGKGIWIGIKILVFVAIVMASAPAIAYMDRVPSEPSALSWQAEESR